MAKINSRLRRSIVATNPQCYWCGFQGTPSQFDVDHLIPRAKGGTNEPSNLVAACSRCNRRRQDETGYAWWGDKTREERMTTEERIEFTRQQMQAAMQRRA